MITITVASGQTLSGIAAQYGTSYQALAAKNGISNPDVIYVGEKIVVSGSGSFSSWTPSHSQPSGSPSHSSYSSSSSGLGGTTSSSGYHIPGVSDSVSACIAQRESTNGQGSSNVFQLQQGYYPGMSLSQQEQVAGQLAASQGVHAAWGVYDGCA